MKNFKFNIIAALVLTLFGASIVYGAYNTTGGGTYRLQSSIGTTDTSVTLTSFKEPISGIKYTMSYLNSAIEYATIDPANTTSKEFISFSGITQNADGTATLTGVTRGLSFSYPFTASTTFQVAHAGQAILILSNPPQLTNQYYNINNDGQTLLGLTTVSATWTFGSTTQPQYDGNPTFSNSLSLIDKAYADALSITGAPTSTFSGQGVSWLATRIQIASSTASSTTGSPLVIPSKFASSTPIAGFANNIIPVTNAAGFISPLFISTSTNDSYIWGGNIITASTTIYSQTTGAVTATSSITYNGHKLSTSGGFGGNGTDGALSVSAGTTTISCGTQSVCEKDYTSISITSTGAVNFTSGGAATSTNGITVILRSQGACTFTSSSLTMLFNQAGGGTGNAHPIIGGAVANTSPGGGGGSGISAGGADSSLSNTNTLSAFSFGGPILTPLSSSTRMAYPGGNGVAGISSGGGGPGGTAGSGGGAFVIECNGAYNFTTGGFQVSGTNGGAGGAGGGNPGGGGGGGGGGGSIFVTYGSLTADTGTYGTAAGSGGAGGSGTATGVGGGAGGAGGHLEVQNTYWY